MLDFEVEKVGGSGDKGADLRLRRRDGLVAVVQCKYHKQGLVGSPELQKFLGTIHHTRSQKGFFVTTSTFTLVGREIRRGKPHRAAGRPAAGRAGPPGDRARNRNARPSLYYSRRRSLIIVIRSARLNSSSNDELTDVV